MTLTATGPEVYVAITTTVLSNYFDSLVDTLNYTKSIKIKDHPGGNVTDFYDAILVDVERFESAGAFKPEHLGYIIHIFEDTYDSRFHIWVTQKYKEVMKFVKKPLLCDKDFMQTDYIITYGLLFQEYLKKHSNIVESKRWKPTDSK